MNALRKIAVGSLAAVLACSMAACGGPGIAGLLRHAAAGFNN